MKLTYLLATTVLLGGIGAGFYYRQNIRKAFSRHEVAGAKNESADLHAIVQQVYQQTKPHTPEQFLEKARELKEGAVLFAYSHSSEILAGKIVMPWEIYKQALQGYAIVTKSDRNFSSSQQEQSDAVEKYLGTEYSLLSEARKHIFRAATGEHDLYASVASLFKDMALEYRLKKENHHDDKGADESIVAAASYLITQKSAHCAIITNDGDIDRIVDRCIPELEKKLIAVYHPPRMENHPLDS